VKKEGCPSLISQKATSRSLGRFGRSGVYSAKGFRFGPALACRGLGRCGNCGNRVLAIYVISMVQ
jgi:hypothetical protein